MVGVKQAERFGHPLAQIGAVLLKAMRAPDIDLPEVERRLAIVHPLRERHAGTAKEAMPIEL